MTLDVLLNLPLTYHLSNGTINTQSYHETIKGYTVLNKGRFLLSSQLSLVIIRKDIATHQNSFSGTSITHYSPTAVWGGSFYVILGLPWKPCWGLLWFSPLEWRFPLVMTDATSPQEQEAGTQMDGLTNLGFLLLFSHPVTHLLPQETSPTSTFLTAVWEPCSGHSFNNKAQRNNTE